MLQLASLGSGSLPSLTLCAWRYPSFSRLTFFFFCGIDFMFLQGRIRCRTERLAQHKVRRIRSAIPKFLFAAQALTLLGHDEINRLIRFNQVNQIKGVRPRHEPKVGCQRSKRKVDHGIRRKDLLT